MRTAKIVLVLLFLTVCWALPAGAVPIVTHTGSTNPLTEGWNIYNSNWGYVGGGSETIGGVSHDYWQVSHPSVLYPGCGYRYNLDAADMDGDWYLSALIRVVDSEGHAWYSSHIPFSVLLVRDDYSSWGLNLGNSVIGIMNSAIQFSHSYAMDTREDYHRYEIFFHANGSGYEDDTASFLVDGIPIFTDVTRSEVQDISSYNGSLRGVWFGSGSSGAYTITNYSDLNWQPVPEPGTLGLFLLGLGLLAWLGPQSSSRRPGERMK